MQSAYSFSKISALMHSKRIRLALVTIFLLTACIQNAVLFEFVSSFKLVHLVGVVLFPIALLVKPSRPLGKTWWAGVTGFALYTIVAYFRYGFNSWLLNGVFCVYTMWCVWKLSEDFDKNDWLMAFRIVAVVMIILVLVNMFFQFDKLWKYMQNPGFYHPVFRTIFGGGPNLEASWIGLFCFVMAGTVWWRPYYATSVVISLLTNSRAGFLANGAFAVWMFVHWVWATWKGKTASRTRDSYDRKESVLSIVLVLCIVCGYSLAQWTAMYGGLLTTKSQDSSQSTGMRSDGFITESEASCSQETAETQNKGASASLLENLAERMTSIGDEPGSKGRLNMWQYIPTVVAQNPLGYGLGNGIEAVRSCDPGSIPEENLHNIYFQALLDYGVLGATVLLVAVFLFIKKELPTLAVWPISAFIICYLCLGFIQYRMLEVPAWIAITAYVSQSKIKREERKDAQT